MPGIFFPSSKPSFIDAQRVISGLREIAVRTAEKNKTVEAVYLFGSYSEGNAAARSDADIFVILSQDERRIPDRPEEFIMEFSHGPVPVDVMVCTRAEADAAVKEGNRFLIRALNGVNRAKLTIL